MRNRAQTFRIVPHGDFTELTECQAVGQLGSCTVCWMFTGQEKKLLKKAVRAGTSVLVRPHSHVYAGFDGVLEFPFGELVVVSYPLAPGHACSGCHYRLYAEHANVRFHGMVYLLPNHHFDDWRHQCNVPDGVRKWLGLLRQHSTNVARTGQQMTKPRPRTRLPSQTLAPSVRCKRAHAATAGPLVTTVPNAKSRVAAAMRQATNVISAVVHHVTWAS